MPSEEDQLDTEKVRREEIPAGSPEFGPYPAATPLDWIAVVAHSLPALVVSYCSLWFFTRWLGFMMLTPGKWFACVWVIPFALFFFFMQERALASWRRGIVRSPPVPSIFRDLVCVVGFSTFFYVCFVRELDAWLRQERGLADSVASAGNYLYGVSLASGFLMNAFAWIIRGRRRARYGKSSPLTDGRESPDGAPPRPVESQARRLGRGPGRQ